MDAYYSSVFCQIRSSTCNERKLWVDKNKALGQEYWFFHLVAVSLNFFWGGGVW